MDQLELVGNVFVTGGIWLVALIVINFVLAFVFWGNGKTRLTGFSMALLMLGETAIAATVAGFAVGVGGVIGVVIALMVILVGSQFAS
jgi:hypothetical protein